MCWKSIHANGSATCFHRISMNLQQQNRSYAQRTARANTKQSRQVSTRRDSQKATFHNVDCLAMVELSTCKSVRGCPTLTQSVTQQQNMKFASSCFRIISKLSITKCRLPNTRTMPWRAANLTLGYWTSGQSYAVLPPTFNRQGPSLLNAAAVFPRSSCRKAAGCLGFCQAACYSSSAIVLHHLVLN